jgi:hypothetical protein
MKCLETWYDKPRPVGYGMIGREGFVWSWTMHDPRAAITPFPTGRIVSVDFPGISCLATIIWSLRDKQT